MDATGVPGPEAAGEPLLSVLVVGRQPLARAGLRGLLAELRDVRVVGQAAAAVEAAEVAAAERPHVALAAWDAGDREGIAALADALGAAGVPLVLLADGPAPPNLDALVWAGLRGLLLSDATADELGAALHAAAQGLLVLDAALVRALAPADARREVGPATGDPLTEREREVLQLLALGLPNKTIARRLGISEHTAKFHVGSILAKLEAGSRTEAVTRAARRGLLAL